MGVGMAWGNEAMQMASGPITDTTRNVYQRKLAKVMAENTKGLYRPIPGPGTAAQ